MRKALIILAVTMLAGCDRQRNNPGWDYFPDMFYSTAYETYTKNPNFEDGKTMRTPVEGTIAKGYIPFGYDTSPESRVKAGDELVNPFTPDQANIARGQAAYVIYCQQCHGVAGAGDGYLFTSGLYPMKPRPVAGPEAAPLRDGEIYHTITLGFNTMGPHGSLVRPDDRWKIVLYIRQLQQNTR